MRCININKEIILFGKCGGKDFSAVGCPKSAKMFALIGSGLSLAVAGFLSSFLDDEKIPNRIYTPLEYCTGNHNNYVPVIISYRGKNEDIMSVARHIINIGIDECIVITGQEKSKLLDLLSSKHIKTYVYSMPSHTEEHRFVSFRATVSLIILAKKVALALAGDKESTYCESDIAIATANARELAAEYAQGFLQMGAYRDKKWVVLGCGLLDPTSILCQAVFAESALISLQIADYKDYTHGKYLAAFQEQNNAYILLRHECAKEICDRIAQRFASAFDIIALPINNNDFYGVLESVFLIFFIGEMLLAENGFSFSSPPKPSEMRYWTSWGKMNV